MAVNCTIVFLLKSHAQCMAAFLGCYLKMAALSGSTVRVDFRAESTDTE